jgi:RNA polymerase sigma factor (sigma-70 family)
MLQSFFATFNRLPVSNGVMHSEKSLVEKIIAGDLRAFKELVNQYERLVTHMIARIISNQEDVKDISQETFMKVYRNLGKFNFDAKLSTWIAKIAYSTAINHAKKNTLQELPDDVDPEKYMISYETPEHILNAKNEAEFIQLQISKLPLSYRTVLTLYHLNEFSYQEIEDITGMPEGTVKNYLFRARKLLKERLERYYERIK